SVGAAGDVNGDGFDDLILGEQRAGGTGAAYVVFGKSRFAGAIPLGALDGTDGLKLTGELPADYAGSAVSGAGDVNGDGFDDVIIGARAAGGSARGAAYVFFGKSRFTDTPAAGFSIGLGTLDGTDGFKLAGAANFDLTGTSVGAAGDVNGDGFADVIVGASNA